MIKECFQNIGTEKYEERFQKDTHQQNKVGLKPNQMIKPIVIIRFPYGDNKEDYEYQKKEFNKIREHLLPAYYSILTFENVDSIQIEIIECKSNSTPTETTSS